MSDIVQVPPLPVIPSPTDLRPDDRQRIFRHVAGALVNTLFSEVGEMVTDSGNFANGGYGFRASAVDLGALQNLINDGLSRFSMSEIRRRWDVDVFHWMAGAIRMWIQRCKAISFELHDNGISVSIDTQDDRGHYHYEFDVSPAATIKEPSRPLETRPWVETG